MQVLKDSKGDGLCCAVSFVGNSTSMAIRLLNCRKTSSSLLFFPIAAPLRLDVNIRQSIAHVEAQRGVRRRYRSDCQTQ